MLGQLGSCKETMVHFFSLRNEVVLTFIRNGKSWMMKLDWNDVSAVVQSYQTKEVTRAPLPSSLLGSTSGYCVG